MRALRILILSLLFFSSNARAQVEQPISVSEWRAELEKIDTANDIAVLNLATSIAKKSIELLNEGDQKEGLRKSIIGLTLSEYGTEKTAQESASLNHEVYSSLKDFRKILINFGVPESVLKISADNLRIAIDGNSGTDLALSIAPIRQATAKERSKMMSILKNQLIDPNSAIFGEADIIGNKACITVNSKNRFGGYAGNQDFIFIFSKETDYWSKGATTKYTHEKCLNFIRQPL